MNKKISNLVRKGAGNDNALLEKLKQEEEYFKNSEYFKVLTNHLKLKLADIQNHEDLETPESAFKCGWSLANYRGRKQEIKSILSLLN